jgi:hypothetical protein
MQPYIGLIGLSILVLGIVRTEKLDPTFVLTTAFFCFAAMGASE